MENSISLALAGQVALQRRMEVVANNIANASTAGFKLEGQIVQTMPRRTTGDLVVYPIDRGSYTDMTPGAVSLTGNPLDVAIDGPGVLAVQTARGLRYTRDGRLSQSADGTILGSGGQPLVAVGGGTLQLPGEVRELVIAGDGTITADGEEVGRIAVFDLPEGNGLERQADGLFAAPKELASLNEGRLHQGMIEGSNVQSIGELVSMMEVQRHYERVQKVLDGEDERIRRLVDRAVRI
jgi:flagellar basal-body rod protein FlgF